MTGPFFTSEEFTARRARILDHIGPDAIVFLQGAGPVEGFEVPRQTNDFFYLTGLESAQAYLVLDGDKRTSALYLPHSDAHAAGEGGNLGAEDDAIVRDLTGVDLVYSLESLAGHLAGVRQAYMLQRAAEGKYACQDTLRHARKLRGADPWDAAESREERIARLLAEYCAGVSVRDLSPILDTSRLIKSPRELDAMRRAGKICARAVVEAVRTTRPGIFEYQLGAVADYVYRVNGVRYEGYRPIIANGANIWHAHYYRNDSPLIDGDLVLMDYAPDVSNYTSDIGRMWPVNGIYSPVQRELYGFIVKYHKTLLQVIRPGVTPEQVLAEASEIMRPVVETTPFSKPIYAEAARRTLTFAGHLSHPVGMAVHDVGTYFGRPMEPGLTFALDPQMWIPEEQTYIRVEDTVAVTQSGIEVLTAGCPIDLEAMEALMAARSGLIQQFPCDVDDSTELFTNS